MNARASVPVQPKHAGNGALALSSSAGLRLEGVSKSFSRAGDTIQVLQDVTLEVKSGEFVAFVGASGCGKTTLLRIIDGLTEADAGTISLDGRAISAPGRDRGFVFQSDSLLPWRSVRDNVAFGLKVQGIPTAEARARSAALIRLVGLSGFDGHFPHELSGGMRQRVNLARALAIDPAVLLMDEPFAALDAQTRELMQRELLRIWNADRKTVLFVTHQIDEAVYLADRVVVMTARPGRISEVIDVELPRPRDLAIKRTPQFAAYLDRIWRRIEREVEASMT